MSFVPNMTMSNVPGKGDIHRTRGYIVLEYRPHRSCTDNNAVLPRILLSQKANSKGNCHVCADPRWPVLMPRAFSVTLLHKVSLTGPGFAIVCSAASSLTVSGSDKKQYCTAYSLQKQCNNLLV